MCVRVPLRQCHSCAFGMVCSCSVYDTSDWRSIVGLEGHSAAVTGLRFGPDSSSLVSTSMDKTIRVYSA